MSTDKIRILTEVRRIVKFLTDGEYITTALDDLQDTTKQRMKEYEQITTMKILTCDNRVDEVCRTLRTQTQCFDDYIYHLKRVNEMLLSGITLSQIISNLQGNKYESIDWRNNFMPTNYDAYANLLTGTIKVQIDKDRGFFRYNPEITDVKIIVPNKVVEVTFSDGTKEKSVCHEDDTFSLETAIAICISKKIMGGSSAYNNAVKRGIKVYEDKLKREELDLIEKERIEKRRAKRLVYKKRREEKKAQIEKERQIEIQTEAYVRAMKYMNSPASRVVLDKCIVNQEDK